MSREFFPHQGYPDICLTDLGLEFGANTFRDLKDLRTEHGRISSNNLACDGRLENLLNNSRHDYQDHLRPALMACSTSIIVTTGHKPFFSCMPTGPNSPFPDYYIHSVLEPRLHGIAEAVQQDNPSITNE